MSLVYLWVKDCVLGTGSGSDSEMGVGGSWGDMAASSPVPFTLSGVRGDCISPGADS